MECEGQVSLNADQLKKEIHIINGKLINLILLILLLLYMVLEENHILMIKLHIQCLLKLTYAGKGIGGRHFPVDSFWHLIV